jgi:hypothetical protein
MKVKAKRIREKNAVRLTLSKAQALTLWRILARSHILDNKAREAQIEKDEPVSTAICLAIASTGLEYGS